MPSIPGKISWPDTELKAVLHPKVENIAPAAQYKPHEPLILWTESELGFDI